MKLLAEIQKKLIVTKEHYNKFGEFYYRTCDDILFAVKPLLGDAVLVMTDEPIMLGNRFYIKSTVILKNGEETVSVTAYAREPESKKKMDEPQVTGMASSYARKFALSGLFGLDDSKDPDSQDADKGDVEPKDTDTYEVLDDKQKEFIDKVRVQIEENLDGKAVDKDKLTALMVQWAKAKHQPVPAEDKLVANVAQFLLGREQDLKSIISEVS